jgi:transcriptional regulator with XRE-family HTH domain
MQKMSNQQNDLDGPDDLSRALGVRVRSLRDAAGMTLEQLARASGVSRAMLSKVERGEKSPTIGVVSRIAAGLNTTLTALTADNETSSTTRVILRRSARPLFRDPKTGFERHIVSPATGGGRAELIYHHLPPGTSTGMLPAYPPGTEKQIVVVVGTLVVDFKSSKEQLGPGDSMFFEATIEHAFINPADEPCGYYMVLSRRE